MNQMPPVNYPEGGSKILDINGKDVSSKIDSTIQTASDPEGYIRVGDLFEHLSIQTQYASYYFNEKIAKTGHTFLGEGLRYVRDKMGYHGDRIHKDDARTMVERLSRHIHKTV